MSDQSDRPTDEPGFDPAPPTEVGPPSDPPPAPPPQPAPPPSPYGQAPPPAPYQQPGAPYQQPGAPYQQPGAPYQPAVPYPYQPKSSGGGIAVIVIVVILVVVLLFCGGIGAFIWWFAASVENAIPDRDRPGGPENPITVEQGESFTIDDFEFRSGWTLTSDSFGDPDIEGLRAENTGESSDSASITFTFVVDDEETGDVSCSASNVRPDRTVTMTCYGTGDGIGYDEIEVKTSW